MFLTALSGASSLVSAGSSLLDQHPKDKDRYAKNAMWYQEALQGNKDALIALQYMSGRYGTTHEGSYCNVGGCSGWATQDTRDDAYNKYQAAIGNLPTSSAQGTPNTQTTASAIGNVFSAIGGALSGTPSTVVMTPGAIPPFNAPASSMSPIILAALAVGLYILLRR